MNKKGVETGTIITIILILLTFFALAVVFDTFLRESDFLADREACKLSIIAADKSKLIGLGSPLFDLECDRSKIIIKGKDVVENKELNKDAFFRILQSEMYQCSEIAALSFDPFEEWEDLQTYCLICSEIKFDSGVQREARTIEGFYTWMLDNNLPGMDLTLEEKMSEEPISESDRKDAEEYDTNYPINTSKSYAVVVRWRHPGLFRAIKTFGVDRKTTSEIYFYETSLLGYPSGQEEEFCSVLMN